MTNRDSALERILGRVLSLGATASTALLVVGLVGVFATHASGGLADTALRIGLIVLMGTPVMSVVATTVEYVRRRDWFFVVVALIVLLELAATVVQAL